MSKAFDSINSNQLIEDLRNTIKTDELHIISTLLNVSLPVRCENTLSKVLETDTGAPQGDCASALQFTYSFAKMLEPARSNQLADHPYVEQNVRSSIPDHITEHNYCVITQKDQINIDIEYADDISKATSNHNSMENFKRNTSEILKPRDLNVNHGKTEQYIINRTEIEWRLCKYLAATEWSNIIRKQRLKWFGKVIRADESTPVKRVFNYANAPYQRPRGIGNVIVFYVIYHMNEMNEYPWRYFIY